MRVFVIFLYLSWAMVHTYQWLYVTWQFLTHHSYECPFPPLTEVPMRRLFFWAGGALASSAKAPSMASFTAAAAAAAAFLSAQAERCAFKPRKSTTISEAHWGQRHFDACPRRHKHTRTHGQTDTRTQDTDTHADTDTHTDTHTRRNTSRQNVADRKKKVNKTRKE